MPVIIELTNKETLYCEEVSGDMYSAPLKIMFSPDKGLSFQPLALFNTDEKTKVMISHDKILLSYEPDEMFMEAIKEFRGHYAKAKEEALAAADKPGLTVV